MIEKNNGFYALHTVHTSYLFGVTAGGQLEHYYYGSRVETGADTAAALAMHQAFAPGNTVAYSPAYPAALELLRQEAGTLGKGDVREPFVEIEFADGSTTCDFVFESDEVIALPAAGPSGLPCAHSVDEALCVRLREAAGGAVLMLWYGVCEEADVILRWASVENTGEKNFTLRRLCSAQLDLDDSDWRFTAFRGGWTDEMHRTETLCGSTVAAESRAGCSSSRANPFVMLSRPETTETAGEAMGFHLLYSGSHRETADRGRFGRLRVLTGMHPGGFAWPLAPGECFDSPQAALCFSDAGFDVLSSRLHAFIRGHVLRGEWAAKPRPVLMNSWEACYFKFDEATLLRQAKIGAACGVELFVLDDGWFGERSGDDCALGDWECNRKKLPGGLDGLAKKLRALGLDFGLWVEPEMISVNSALYRAHPGWAMEIPGRAHSEGRNQRVLDLANPDVQEFLIEKMSEVFSSADIRYIKWDMNRIFSDVYSLWAAKNALPQGGTPHRYMLGLYRVLGALTAKFPHILFEACASGGNRTDPGMLCYMPQVWLSDNTDPICRAAIQQGASYGYPASVMGCHVSAAPNHQTLRRTPLHTRWAVALCGQLGYELDFAALTRAERKEITAQTAQYKGCREWLMNAEFHRLVPRGGGAADAGTGSEGGVHAGQARWMAVSADKTHAIVADLRVLAQPDAVGAALRTRGLDDTAVYRFSSEALPVDLRTMGSLVNTVSPVHVRPGGVLHSVAAQFVQLPGEKEEYLLPGSVLNRCGVQLKAPYAGTGLDENVAVREDFSARVYRLERVAVEEKERL